MAGELYAKCSALTKHALELQRLVVEELCYNDVTCAFPDDIFTDAVEHARICFMLANYTASAFENDRALVTKFKIVLQRLVDSSINNMSDNMQLDVAGCMAFFSMICRVFKEPIDGEGFQICMYKDILANFQPDIYILENRIAHVTFDFATQMLELIAHLD
jgi:hypothetical protein